MRRAWPILFAFAAVILSATRPTAAAPKDVSPVDLIEIDGSINPASANFIHDAIQQAAGDGASALVIELDTPGGLLSSARRIVRDILGARVPVIVYVAPAGASAASAGMFITIAAHVAAMAPGTTIGAAHPVDLGGGGGQQEKGNSVMDQKVENFTASFAQSIAAQRGRNQKWAEEAVRHSASLSERDALSQHVIDIVAADISDLLSQSSGREVTVDGKKRVLELKGAPVRRHSMTLRQRVLNLVADPNLVYLLLMAGVVGIYFEFAHPGVFLPGVVGAICLLLALTSFEVLPINVAGLLLLLFGISLLIAEAFVPTHGVFGIGGVTAFVLGSLFLIDRSESSAVVNLWLIGGAAAAFSTIVIGIGTLVVRTRRRPVTTGREGLVGEIGEVRDRIPAGAGGRVFVHGENWRASSDREIEPGARVQVVAVRGGELVVKPV